MAVERGSFAQWCVLELMGRRRLGGFVEEVTVAGAGFLRVEIPDADGGVYATQLYTPGSVYCITPTTEEMARVAAASSRPSPVTRWELEPADVEDDDDEPFFEPFFDEGDPF